MMDQGAGRFVTPRLGVATPGRRAGKREVDFLGVVAMGRISDFGAEEEEADGDLLARDRPALADEFGPAVALEEIAAEILGVLGLSPCQARRRRFHGLKKARRVWRPGAAGGAEPFENRQRARRRRAPAPVGWPVAQEPGRKPAARVAQKLPGRRGETRDVGPLLHHGFVDAATKIRRQSLWNSRKP